MLCAWFFPWFKDSTEATLKHWEVVAAFLQENALCYLIIKEKLMWYDPEIER